MKLFAATDDTHGGFAIIAKSHTQIEFMRSSIASHDMQEWNFFCQQLAADNLMH